MHQSFRRQEQTDLTENRYFLSYNTNSLTTQHDTTPFELSPRGAPDGTSGNRFSACISEHHDQALVHSFGLLGEVRLPQVTGLYGSSKIANPSLSSSLTTDQDCLSTTILDDASFTTATRLHDSFTHSPVISTPWYRFEEGELDRVCDISKQPLTIEQFLLSDMVPELSLLSESTDISGRPHQFAEFDCGLSLQVFVPIVAETPIIKAAGSLSQGIHPPESDFDRSSVPYQFTDLPGRPAEFNSSGPRFQGSVPMAEKTEKTPKTRALGSPLKEMDLSKGDFDRSRGIE